MDQSDYKRRIFQVEAKDWVALLAAVVGAAVGAIAVSTTKWVRVAFGVTASVLLLSALTIAVYSTTIGEQSELAWDKPVTLSTQLDLDELPIVDATGDGSDIYARRHEGKLAWNPIRKFAVWSGPAATTKEECEAVATRSDQHGETPLLNPVSNLGICMITDKGNIAHVTVIGSSEYTITFQVRRW